MTKSTDAFKNIVENQNQLVETMNKNAQEMAELFKVDREVSEKGQEILKEYWEKQQHLTEASMKFENVNEMVEKWPDHYAKAMELQMDFYNKTMDFYRQIFEKYTDNHYPDMFKKATELYQKNFEAMVETTKSNTEAFQSFFKQ